MTATSMLLLKILVMELMLEPSVHEQKGTVFAAFCSMLHCITCPNPCSNSRSAADDSANV